MDFNNWVMLEMLATEQAQDRARERGARSPEENESRRGGIKRALAAAFVRLGLRLDPAAGEGLSGLELSPARREARR
ncbi:MAG: hypothetical protein IH959_02275 [Chloroflexi bacterium]|nr:hypothetical protein [Chloroflexota bacterium]